mgnify:CR=1 FL=1
MSAIEYKLNYFKKYFPFKHFIKDLPDLIGEQEIDLITNLIWYVNFKFSHKIFVNSDFFSTNGQKVISDFHKRKNKLFKDEISKYVYEGNIFSKMNNNFKLVHYYEFGDISHSFIKSKFKNMYFHLLCLRDWNKIKDKPSKTILLNSIVKIFKKKINKEEFFEHIIKRDKKNGNYKRNGSLTYTSLKGIDYLDLYKKGKL